MTFRRLFNTPKRCNADFPSQSARERNLHHLQRPADNGPHISLYPPYLSRANKLWPGPGTLTWKRVKSKQVLRDPVLFWQAFNSCNTAMPQSKYRDNRDCRFLSMDAWKKCNILKEKFGFCTLSLVTRIFTIIYNVLQHQNDKLCSPESWSSLLTSLPAENNRKAYAHKQSVEKYNKHSF